MYDIEKMRDGSELIRHKGYRVGVRNAAYQISLSLCSVCQKPIGCDREFYRIKRTRDGRMTYIHKPCTKR
jgi:hypothetical protein